MQKKYMICTLGWRMRQSHIRIKLACLNCADDITTVLSNATRLKRGPQRHRNSRSSSIPNPNVNPFIGRMNKPINLFIINTWRTVADFLESGYTAARWGSPQNGGPKFQKKNRFSITEFDCTETTCISPKITQKENKNTRIQKKIRYEMLF